MSQDSPPLQSMACHPSNTVTVQRQYGQHAPDMICITRYFDGHLGVYFFRVAITRNRKTFQKRFYEHHFGGEEATRKLAQAWRDDIMATHSAMSLAEYCSILRSSNTSDVPGVAHRIKTDFRRSGSVSIYHDWIALIPSPNGKHKLKSFSVSKYGYEEAKRKAIAARELAIEALRDIVLKASYQPESVSKPEDIETTRRVLRAPKERRDEKAAQRLSRRELVKRLRDERRVAAQLAEQRAMEKSTNTGEPYIYRHDRQNSGGYVKVQFERHGTTHVEYFKDSTYGSAGAALDAAKRWRDDVFSALPLTTKAQIARRILPTNTSGVSGVFRVRIQRAGKVEEAWRGCAPKQKGKSQPSKTFLIAKFGEQGAFELAVAARLAFVAELEDVPHLPKHAIKQMMRKIQPESLTNRLGQKNDAIESSRT